MPTNTVQKTRRNNDSGTEKRTVTEHSERSGRVDLCRALLMAGSSGSQGVLALQGVNIFLDNFRRRGEQFPIEIIWVAAELLKAEHIERCKLVEGTHEGRKFRPSRAINVPGNNANVIS